MKGEAKRIRKRLRQEELLKNFSQTEDHYEEKRVGDQWYIKMYNGGTKLWQVCIYSEESFQRYLIGKNKHL